MKSLLKILLFTTLIFQTPASVPDAVAEFPWEQLGEIVWTTDTDFNSGDLVGAKVVGAGESASVELDLAGMSSFAQEEPNSTANSVGSAPTTDSSNDTGEIIW